MSLNKTLNIRIELIADHKELVPKLAQLWYQELGRRWVPTANLQSAQKRFLSHLNQDKLPLMLVAFSNKNPVGMQPYVNMTVSDLI